MAGTSAPEDLLERIAWRILTDLLKPDSGFQHYPPEGLQQLIGLRLVREARKAQVPAESLARAFERAWEELSGTRRLPADGAQGSAPSASDSAGEDDAPETIENL